jgi:uncharacterized protein YdeI (YjbR/CyaY-like superfamily)
MKGELQTFFARDSAAWRRWLERHHDSGRGVWLVFYKKHPGKPSVTYAEALEEALCFGWIDSIVKRVDDERYMQKFTPRTNPKKWSAVNLAHMRRLLAQRRVTPAGRRVLGVPLGKATVHSPAGSRARPRTPARPAVVPAFLQAAIACDRDATACWEKLAPSHRRRYVLWILDAKRDETRERRLAEAVRLLAQGVRELLK